MVDVDARSIAVPGGDGTIQSGRFTRGDRGLPTPARRFSGRPVRRSTWSVRGGPYTRPRTGGGIHPVRMLRGAMLMTDAPGGHAAATDIPLAGPASGWGRRPGLAARRPQVRRARGCSSCRRGGTRATMLEALGWGLLAQSSLLLAGLLVGTVALAVTGAGGETAGMRTRRPRPAPDARSAFAGFRFPPEVIVLAVRWYLRFGLSYRDLEELLTERLGRGRPRHGVSLGGAVCAAAGRGRPALPPRRR